MAWTEANPVSIGDATKKAHYDALWANADYLVDYIKGDNAQGSGATGHDHDGTDSLAVYIGTDTVDQDAIETAAVGQGELKTATSVASSDSDTLANITPSGVGSYGFWPQLNVSASNGNAEVATTFTNTTYATYIALSNDGAGGVVARAQFRYVSASGPLYWIFMLREKSTNEIRVATAAPDHPCFGQGGDPEIMPHPFTGCFDEETDEFISYEKDGTEIRRPGYEILAIVMPQTEANVLLQEVKDGPCQDMLEMITADYELDETEEEKWPSDTDVTVELDVDIFSKKATVKKAKIPKPTKVKCYKLKKKQ